MSKMLVFGDDARKKILNGANTIADAIGCTLGPRGKNVIFEKGDSFQISKDGVSVAKEVVLEDPFENMGAQVIRKASEKTCIDAGDGTTSSSLLAKALLVSGSAIVSAGHNPVNIKRGIDWAVERVVARLKEMSKPVSSKWEISRVGTISANEDSEIGEMVADAMEKVGNEGIITLEEGKSIKTELTVTTGYQFDRGYLSPHFVNNDKSECELKNPLILICEKEVNNVNVMLPILQACHEKFSGRPLLVIAENVAGDALPTLIVNAVKKSFTSCAVKAPGFGDRRKEMLCDLAILTGASLVSEDLGRKLENFEIEWLGSAKKVTVSKGSTTIVEGAGAEEAVEARVNEIRSAMGQYDGWDREKQEERLAKLVGGVAVISVGAATEVEMKEKKDRVDDCLNAVRSAVQEGIVPGGGVALLRASKILDEGGVPSDLEDGVKIVRRACEEPFRKIVLNAGKDPTEIRLEVLNNPSVDFGYNARTEVYEDLMKSGVIDPTKVVRCSLQNAASVVGLILTTECMIADKPEVVVQNK